MTHSGEKPHKCSQCEFSSITTGHLTIHMRSAHTGEKPYKCEICSLGFVSARYLRIHTISHAEEKTFVCNNCRKTFKHPGSLTRHGQKHSVSTQILFFELKINHKYNLFVTHWVKKSQNKNAIAAILDMILINMVTGVVMMMMSTLRKLQFLAILIFPNWQDPNLREITPIESFPKLD